MRAKLCSPQAKWKRIEMRKKFEDFFWFLSSPTKCLLCFFIVCFSKNFFVASLFLPFVEEKELFFCFLGSLFVFASSFSVFQFLWFFFSDQLKMENKFMKCDTLGYPKPCINVETRDTKILGK